MAPSSCPPDPFMQELAASGYTPENLPALKQFETMTRNGNLEAARRIQENLRAFFQRGVRDECRQGG